jgi:hypothetical protein
MGYQLSFPEQKNLHLSNIECPVSMPYLLTDEHDPNLAAGIPHYPTNLMLATFLLYVPKGHPSRLTRISLSEMAISGHRPGTKGQYGQWATGVH